MQRYAVLIMVAWLVATGSGAARVIEPAASKAVVRGNGGWMARGANPKHAWLYVAGFDNGVVSIYDLARQGIPLIGQLTNIPSPNGITLGADGTLYVATYDHDAVWIYLPGATKPNVILTQGLTEVVDVAVDAIGNVYAFSRGATPNIAIFPPGQTAPSGTITSSLFQHPMSLAFDEAGNLLTSDFYTAVSEIPAGSQVPVSLGLRNIDRTLGVARGSDGDVFACVSLHHRGSQTAVYRPHRATTRRFLEGGNVAGDFLTFGKMHGAEYLFEAIYNTNTVLIYKHGSRALYGTIASASSNAEGVAFKPAGVP